MWQRRNFLNLLFSFLALLFGLLVKHYSKVFGFYVLKKLKVPLNDIKEETAQVGKKEALHLLVASFLGDSTLTDVFIRHAPISDKVTKIALLYNASSVSIFLC
ncbi:hypothetical protein ACFX12_029351 [Malus domestica]